MFFEKRVYQGSSGVVYPNPVIDKIYDERVDKTYTGVFLENEYLKIMILPEIGGRVQMAYDKIKERHFIYYNQVIKPALVGLCGPWISGGIEFNWPQHHRPSTFESVDFSIEEHDDGSKTVWVNEVEKMFHTKCMTGFKLYTDHAYLEINAKLFNRSPLPQTFLWWANPAVKVNDRYQSVFPPDVKAVFDHGKRDVSDFPIATGTYYKVDYSPGTDISMYKNIPVPTSYMAMNSTYDFVGGYEHDVQAGMLHIADHHVSPGKKQWTWGNGDFGIAWDRNLTDEDGPYIELMAGVYTDNQPDFTWIMPFEEKTFTQYFLPYRELGVVKNASKDILLNAEKITEGLKIQVFATSKQKDLIILLADDSGNLLWEANVECGPHQIFEHVCHLGEELAIDGLVLTIHNSAKDVLLTHRFKNQENKEIPEAAKAALLPEEILNTEQLFLTGQHLEQYRHATYSPVPYYERALTIDSCDIRNNNALGVWYLRRGKFTKSERYFKTAVKTLIGRNPNPYDGEPYFNLGLCLWYQLKKDEAYQAFFKAAWSSAWQDAAYFYVAAIDFARGHFEKCLEHIEWSLDRNARNGKAYIIKIKALLKLGRFEEALDCCQRALARDRFNINALFELEKYYNLSGNHQQAKETHSLLTDRSRSKAHSLIEYAIDYIHLEQYADAIALLQMATDDEKQEPMLNYYLCYCAEKSGDHQLGKSYLKNAIAAKTDYCFPNRLEDILVLQLAISLNPQNGNAYYYLGLLYYDKRQYQDAIDLWEQAARLSPGFPTVFRNLGIAVFNKLGDKKRALELFEKAFNLDQKDARVLMELDQLYKRCHKLPQDRISFLEKHINVAFLRDDLYLELISLHNFLGEYKIAQTAIMNRKFHPWEGGEGKVAFQYTYSLIETAKRQIWEKNLQQAIDNLQAAQVYPHNLGEGKLPGTPENDIFYWMGCAYELLEDLSQARHFWNLAIVGQSEPTVAVFYNDQQPDKIFYQGLALEKLGDTVKANQIFNRLVDYGAAHLNDKIKIDYFAVSLPDLMIFDDDLDYRNIVHCLYMQGLGLLGLKDYAGSEAKFDQVLAMDAMHFGAKTHLSLLKNEIQYE